MLDRACHAIEKEAGENLCHRRAEKHEHDEEQSAGDDVDRVSEPDIAEIGQVACRPLQHDEQRDKKRDGATDAEPQHAAKVAVEHLAEGLRGAGDHAECSSWKAFRRRQSTCVKPYCPLA